MTSSRSSIRTVGVILIALAAPALGGSGDLWNAGIILILLGVVLIGAPPKCAPGWLFSAASIGLVCSAAAAFLPAKWFGIPAWRLELVEQFGVRLPASLTVHPWITAEGLILLVAGLSWLWLVAAEPWGQVERELVTRAVGGGVVLLALFAMIARLQHWQIPFWTGDRISPFPNRNHFSDLLATWSVVVAACAYDDSVKRRGSAAFWVAGLAVLLWALIANYSRAGIAIFFLGIGHWAGLLCIRSRGRVGIAVAAAGLLIAGSGFLIYGGDTLERFAVESEAAEIQWDDFRWPVFQDTLRMIRQSPALGVGLGNFDTVFALFRDASFRPVRVVHPESDLLLILAQLGLAGLVCITALGVVLFNRARKFGREEAPLRMATLVGAAMFALHGFVDVSGHSVGSALPAFLLCALSIRPESRRERTAGHSTRLLLRSGFIFLGIVFVVIGVVWIRGWMTKRPPRGSLEVELLQIDTGWAYEERRFDDALALADEGLAWAPLDWKLRYYRGAALAYLGRESEALPEFRLARKLEPTYPNVAFDEGRIWSFHGPAHVAEAWGDLLRRDPARARYWFGEMLRLTEGKEGLRETLRALAGERTDLRLDWMAAGGASEFQQGLTEWLIVDPELKKLSYPERAQLLRMWQRLGDGGALRAEFERRREWQQQHWEIYASLLAAGGDFKKAFQVAMENVQPPVLPSISGRDALADEREFARRPGDLLSGLHLAIAQMEAGKTEDALRTIELLERVPNRPDYLSFLKGKALGSLGRWEEAWQALGAWKASAKG
jgi:Flp pilus assembly protein TadD